jgi:hypothetical protein
MNYKVLNNSIDFFGARFLTKSANILENSNVNLDEERRKLLSEVFEQFMFFDNCVIKTGRHSTSLFILIHELGINKVEELVQKGDIQFLFWTQYIAIEQGKYISGPIVRKFGEDSDLEVYDDSKILGRDPLIITDVIVNEYDAEKIVDFSLNNIFIHPDRKKILKKIVLDNYIIPTISDAQLAKDFVIDAYKKNSFAKLGLGFNKEPNMLNSPERMKLMHIAYDVFENTLIANHNIKYYSNYNFFDSFRKNLFIIANSLKVTKDASTVFQIENIPDLKKIFIEDKIDLKSVFDLRQLPNAKYFRKWINEKSESVDSIEITKEYLNELKNSSIFFNKSNGKLLKTLGVFSVGAGLGAAISGIDGSIIGGIAGLSKDLGLSLLDTFWLEKIAAGKAPSMFIDDIRKYIDVKNN